VGEGGCRFGEPCCVVRRPVGRSARGEQGLTKLLELRDLQLERGGEPGGRRRLWSELFGDAESRLHLFDGLLPAAPPRWPPDGRAEARPRAHDRLHVLLLLARERGTELG